MIQKENQGYRLYDTVWLDYHSWITLYTLHLLYKKRDLPSLASVNPCTYPIYNCIMDRGILRQSNFIGDTQMLKLLPLINFLSFNRASECFRLTNLTIALLSCPLLFLESESLWQPWISFRFISTPESLPILITVFSRSLSGMLFGIHDIFTLFLRLYCSSFFWFFSRFCPLICG